MDKFKRAIPSIMLSVMLVFGMFAGFYGLAYADADEGAADISLSAQIADAAEESAATSELGAKEAGTNIEITEANRILQGKEKFKKYELIPDSQTYREYGCSAYMPVAGTLIVEVGSDQGASYNATVSGQGVTRVGSDVAGGSTSYVYTVSSAGTVNIDVTVYESGRSAWVGAAYVAAKNTVSANESEYVLGSTGYGAVSTFKVKAPSTGYLRIETINELYTQGSVNYRTKGFKSWEYRSGGAPITIGVKKGTYTISLKNAQYYGLKVKFTKVKETSAKTSKQKAAKIKKGKANKGIIAVNSKKVHWYKIKNTKHQKINIVFNAKNMSGGGSAGSVRITAYFPNGSK